jgi:hypothetical protein
MPKVGERGRDRAGRVRLVFLLAPVAFWLLVVDFYRSGHPVVGFMDHALVVALWVEAVVVTGVCGYWVVRGGRDGRRVQRGDEPGAGGDGSG